MKEGPILIQLRSEIECIQMLMSSRRFEIIDEYFLDRGKLSEYDRRSCDMIVGGAGYMDEVCRCPVYKFLGEQMDSKKKQLAECSRCIGFYEYGAEIPCDDPRA